MGLKKFAVCIDPSVDDEEFDADGYWFDEDKGTLKLLVDRKPVVVFPQGAWRYCKEIKDDGAR